MFVIIGYVVALGCIFGGYIIAGGNIGVILKALPLEMLIIMGGAMGAFVVNNQPKVLKATLKAIPKALKGSKYTKARYMELLAMLYEILQKARKEGLMAIEKDVEAPHESEIFKKYPVVGNDHHVAEFITDYLRMMVSGNLNAHEIESLKTNYGVAGVQFIRWLVQNKQVAISVLNKVRAKLKEEFRATSDERYWTAGNSCIVAASILLGDKYAGILNVPIKPIIEELHGLVNAARAALRGSKRSAEDILNAYTRENYGKFIVVKSVDGITQATLGGDGVIDQSISRTQVGAC